MNYNLIRNLLDLMEQFESENEERSGYPPDIEGFKQWMLDNLSGGPAIAPDWEGKSSGRTAESVVATLIVHMNRYAKNYFRAALAESDFSGQDDVIYLIVLRFSPPLTKMELIKKNVHDKPAGIQIINRLIAKGWAVQTGSDKDKRSKIISITPKGVNALDEVMAKVRQATDIVSAKLSQNERMQLIGILNKLDSFHQEIYDRNYEPANLLENAMKAINDN